MSEVVACGPSVTLDISETLHVKSAVVESTKHLNVSGEIPNPLQCPIARLFNGCFIAQKYWSDDAAYPITLPTREGHHLIAVRLDKDEEVCISFKDLFFLVNRGVGQAVKQHETIELGFGQFECSGLFDRILRRNYKKGCRQLKNIAADRNFSFLHRFEQCPLNLGGCSIDLVGQQ